MIVKALIENTTNDPELQPEHGLSLYIEANGRKILFDSGQSPAFAHNAAKLNVDLSKVDTAVLSHGHYDHGGGLPAFLSLNGYAPVYLSEHAFGEYISGSGEYLGINPALRNNPRLRLVTGVTDLGGGLSLLTGEGRALSRPIEAYGLCMRRDGVIVSDDFRHEQYLLITEGNRRVLISGCSHKGIVNIMHWFRPDVMIGGLHLMKLDPLGDGKAALDAVAKELLQFGTVYYACHCTGVPQYEYLKAQMQDSLFYISTGQEITL
ncbi:MAG: MBL fold metallo-hydrolase [Bacillota bacterium]